MKLEEEVKAQMVIDLLVGHFLEVHQGKSYEWTRDYLNLIKWSLEDYEESGYNMDRQRKKYEILHNWIKNSK